MSDKPLVLLVATYPDRESAEHDYDNVMALHEVGSLGHVAAAVLAKDDSGYLTIHRHDTTAKHLAWAGAIAGGLVGVLVPPLGALWVAGAAGAGMTAGIVVDGSVLAGLGGAMGYFWHNIPRKDLREMGDLLEAGQAALVVVAVDRELADIENVITHAVRKISRKVLKGDIEAAYDEAIKAAVRVATMAGGGDTV